MINESGVATRFAAHVMTENVTELRSNNRIYDRGCYKCDRVCHIFCTHKKPTMNSIETFARSRTALLALSVRLFNFKSSLQMSARCCCCPCCSFWSSLFSLLFSILNHCSLLELRNSCSNSVTISNSFEFLRSGSCSRSRSAMSFEEN